MPNPELLPSDESLLQAGSSTSAGQITPSDESLQYVANTRAAMLRASAEAGLQQKPDRAAQVTALASATRLPADLVDRNLDEVARAAKLNQMDLQRVQREHPELADWLANPHNLAMAQDDLPVLRTLDRAVRGLVAGPGDDPLGYLQPGFRFGPNGTIIEENGPGKPGFNPSPEDMATGRALPTPAVPAGRRVYQSLQALDAELGHRAWWDAAAADFARYDQQQLQADYGPASQLVAGAIGSIDSTERALHAVGLYPLSDSEGRIQQRQLQAYADAAPGFSGSVQRGIGGLAADLPLMLFGGAVARAGSSLIAANRLRATVALLTGTRTAKALTTFATTAASVQPLAIREGLSDSDQNGVASGLANWLIETVIPGAFGRTGIQRALVPGVDKLTTGAAGWVPAAKHLLVHAGFEGTEESVTELAHALFESASGQNPNALTPGQLLPRLAAAGAVGGLAGGAFNLPEAIHSKFERDALQIRQSTLEADSLAAAWDLARSSKVAERSPDQLQALIESHTGTAGTTTYFQSEDFVNHFEGKGEDPAAAAQRMGVDPATFEAARAAKAAIPVPTAGFLAHTDETDRPLLDKATMRADGLNRTQLSAATEDVRTLLQGAVNEAKNAAEAETPADAPMESAKAKIRSEVEAQLIAAGRSATEARNGSVLVSEPIANLADRFNRQSRVQADREALAAWRRAHSGNEPDRTSDEWKQAVEEARAKAPVIDAHELYTRYFRRISGPTTEPGSQRSFDQPAGDSRTVVPQSKVEAARAQITTAVQIEISPDVAKLPDTVRLPGGETARFDSKAKNTARSGRAIKRSMLAKAQDLLDHAVLIDSGAPDASGRKGVAFDYYLVRVKTEHGERDQVITIRRTPDGLFVRDIGSEGSSASTASVGDSFTVADRPGSGADDAGTVPPAGEPGNRQLDQPARGKIDIYPGHSLAITLLETADRSTFVHELGHAYLEILSDLATHGGAPDSLVADVAALRTWLGADEKSGYTVDQHEQFARALERYLFEGKAPSSTLRRAFANFANWMGKIYSSVLALNVDLTPEVRGVFDRLFASDAAIARANEEIGNRSPWETAEEAGMTEEQFKSYLAAIEYRRDRAADFVRARLMHDQFEAETAEREAEREAVEAQFAAALDAQPVYAAIRHLQAGEAPPGVELPAGATFKISKDDLLRFYGPDDLAKLPGPQGKTKDLYGDPVPKANRGERIYTAKEGGVPLADAALVFGFQDGDAFIQALSNAPDRDATLQQQVDDEMAKRHPDALVDGSLDILAKGELADQLAGHVLDREVGALGKRVGQAVAPTEILRQVAAELISRTKGSNLRPETYWNAARTASREAFAAAAKARDGKPEARAKWDRKAFDAAQRERFNLHLYRAAVNAQEAGEKGRKYLAKFDQLDTRQKIGKAGGWEFTVYDEAGTAAQVVRTIDDARKAVQGNPGWSFARTNGYLEQIDNILEGYELRRVSNKALRRREGLREWIARQEADGEPVNIPDEVVADLGRRNWTELTVAEQGSVVDAVRNVEKLAKLKNELLKAQRDRDMDTARTTLAGTPAAPGSIVANAPRTIPKRIGTTLPEAISDRFFRFFEDHRKDSFLAREMDGFKDGGPMWEYLIRPRNEAADAEGNLLNLATIQRDADFGAWDKKAGVFRQDIAGTKLRLTAEQRLGLVLNWGNAEGRQRVLMYLNQLGFGQVDMRAVIDSLDEADWELVNATWKQLDSYWSEIRAIEQRTTGVPPEKVEAVPIESRFGTQSGGYYPIKYDQRLSSKSGDLQAAADAKQALRAAYGANQTRRGHTKLRARDVQGLALRLDFGVVGEHLAEVIHDLTHRELLIDQNRLLRDQDIAQAIIDHYGRGALDQFVNTAADIAVGDRPARAASERFLRALRKNSSAAAFGFNLTSALVNITGLSQSIPRVGVAFMANAAARMFRDAAHLEASSSWVNAKSSFMRGRATTQLQHLHEATGKVEPGSTLADVRRWGYYPMHKVQQAVDLWTWVGAYERALSEGSKAGKTYAQADSDAVAIADQTVIDTQGSGRIGDLSAFQRGGEVSKVLTAFYSYFNVVFNLQREAVQQVRAAPADPWAWVKAGTDTALVWVLPALASSLLASALRGDKREDPAKKAKRLAWEEAGYGAGMLVGVRELGGALTGGHGYSGPAGLRSFDVANETVLQLRQGKLDKGLAKAAIAASGALLGLPAVEVSRIVDAVQVGDETGSAVQAFRAAAFGKPR